MLSQTRVGLRGDCPPTIDAAEIVAIWGGETKVLSLPQREPVFQSSVSSEGVWLNMGWCLESAKAQGLLGAVAFALMRGGIVANVAFGRHVNMGPFTEDEMALLRLLAPHFARAFDIRGVLDATRAKSATFWEALTIVASGVVLVDAEGRVVRANAAAQKMMAAGDPLLQRSGRLQLRGDELESRAFDYLLSAAVNREHGRAGVVGVPGRWIDGRRCVAQVMPMHAHSGGAMSGAAVFVSESKQVRPPRESLALLFDLTPAELRVMELIAEGKTRAAVGRRLSIAPATVKVHLRSIFRKTSMTRQPELVHLIRGLAPPT
jgi:DNA-binding CsgD family transcriptional regulator